MLVLSSLFWWIARKVPIMDERLVLWQWLKIRLSTLLESHHSWLELLPSFLPSPNDISVPFKPGVFSIPYPFWHSSNLPLTTSAQTLTANSLYQLELLLAQQTAPSDTAAIIVEPVLGEGGYVPAPPEFLQGLRKVCDKHGIILIADEVQSGFGRTGSYFAIEESGVRPDILVMAKVGFSIFFDLVQFILSFLLSFLICH